jgi:hypothetical protein
LLQERASLQQRISREREMRLMRQRRALRMNQLWSDSLTRRERQELINEEDSLS